MYDPIKKNSNIEQYWFLADKWFRILEFSLVLGVLEYFSEKINSIALKIVYYISWMFFYWFFLEIGESIAKKMSINYKGKRWLIWTVSMFVVLGFYQLIVSVGALIQTR